MSFLKQKGFTLMELLVVISIMVLMASILIVNYNRQRSVRNLRIAQNQLATNIRKTQSYILSARNVSSGGTNVPAKYYGLRFDTNSTQYLIQSIDTNYNLVTPVETVNLPQGIRVSAISYVTAAGASTGTSTIQLAFAAPYAKLYSYVATDCVTQGSLAAAVQSPSCLLTLADRRVVVTLQDTASSTTRTVTVFGVSGNVEAN